MSKVLVTEQHLQNIAEAIREKLDSQDTYRPGDMAAAIGEIDGYPEPTGTVTITQNGTANVKDYAAAAVNVQPNLQSKTATQNGTVTPDSGYDGLSSVVVDVPGGGVEGIIYGTVPPDSNVGENGDYYYRRILWNYGILSYDEWGVSTAANSGIEFIPTENLIVTGLRGMTKSAKTGKMRIGTLTEVLAEVSDITFTANEPVVVTLDEPITLTAGTHYVVQLMVGSGGGAAYTNNSLLIRAIKRDSRIQYVQARYGASYPGSTESGSQVFADVVLSEGRYLITAQYFKSAGNWDDIYHF